jgi:hypothetical protein
MKIATHDDQSKVDCVVKANENPLREHNNHVSDDGVFVSWLPVADGQRLTVDVACNVFTKEVIFDFVVDGVLRNSVASSSREWVIKRHTAKFHSAFQMVDGKAADCELVVKDLIEDEQRMQELEDQGAVGRIEVHIWVLQEEGQVRANTANKSFLECTDWRHLDNKNLYSIIQPSQEITLTTTDCSTPTAAKVTSLKKRLAAARPGEKPWVSFQFYYRTQYAINNGGMLRAPKHTLKNMLKFTPAPLPNIGDDDEVGQDQADEHAPGPDDVQGGTEAEEVAPDLGSLGVEGADQEGGDDGQGTPAFPFSSQHPQHNSPIFAGPDLESVEKSSANATTEQNIDAPEVQMSKTTTTTTMPTDTVIVQDPNSIVDHNSKPKPLKSIEGSNGATLDESKLKPRTLTPVDSKTGSLTPEPTPKPAFAIPRRPHLAHLHLCLASAKQVLQSLVPQSACARRLRLVRL